MENSDKILVLIQARMSSSRLPGKVLTRCAQSTILEWIINRLQRSRYSPNFLVATTAEKSDLPIAKWCIDHGIACYKGPQNDVLMRFQEASNLYPHAQTIVRICADNPLSSYRVMDEVLEEYFKGGYDYVSNSNHEPDFLEDGFDVEVFSRKALELAFQNARLASEREHVCPWMKKHLKAKWIRTCPEYTYKLSVDTAQDLKAVERIFQELGQNTDFAIWEVNELLKKKPEILQINKDSVINSGYHKSLEEDRRIEKDEQK